MNHVPTDHYPGSHEKKQVLAERAAMGLPLFHPHDRTDFAGVKVAIAQTTRAKRAASFGRVAAGVKMSAGRKMLCE